MLSCKASLGLLGWIQQEIGDLFGLDRKTITTIAGELTQVKTSAMDAFWKETKTV